MKQSKPLFNEFDETICILIDFLSTEFHSELDTSKTFTGYKKITFEKKNYSMGNLIVFHFSETLKRFTEISAILMNFPETLHILSV